MAESCLPSFLLLLIAELFEPLHARSHWRLTWISLGALFAQGRQTVSRWLRSADLSDDNHEYYVHCGPGRDTHSVVGSSRSRLGTARTRNCAMEAPDRGTTLRGTLLTPIDVTPYAAYAGTMNFDAVLPSDE